MGIDELVLASTLPGVLERLRGSTVLIAVEAQLSAALALLELDGLVRRMVLCTPDLTAVQLADVARLSGADAVVSDGPLENLPGLPLRLTMHRRPVPSRVERYVSERTEWILLTSGTTGTPKLIVHSLESLGGGLPTRTIDSPPVVWSTFYDIRRYGGLQIYLRAVLGGAPFVLSHPREPVSDFLARAAAAGVTHVSGTPSHWRRVLMSDAATLAKPQYVRLSGEVADQPLLDNLHAAFPGARIAHAFASTEAGVAFDVDDGLAGFPAALLRDAGEAAPATALKVQEGTLRVRSRGNGARYLGEGMPALVAEDGFVDTGDLVESVAGRCLFRGRRGGVINVGGLKVYPEEVEAILNADSRVRVSRVRARRSPITGAIVVAEIVPAQSMGPHDGERARRLRSELLSACRSALPEHKVPAMLNLVPALDLTAAGKLVRPNE